MPHQAETQSPAINPAPTACTVRKRLILLCCEDLRPVACALEGALRTRGWQVDVEFGADARPWVQKAPPAQPSVRVLCVPGTIDRALAKQLRAAFRPDPEADLHILGVDDSPGLVYEIERLAGMKHPRRRSLHAQPPMAQVTRLEAQARSDRSWRMATVSAMAAFAITFGGMQMVDWAADGPATSSFGTSDGPSYGASLTSLTSPSATPSVEPLASPIDEPVLSAVALTTPADWAEGWAEDSAPEEDFDLVIFDDEVEPSPARRVHVLATPLAAPASAITVKDAITITDAVTITTPVMITSPLPTLPAGFLPVAGLLVSDAATKPVRQLPRGFLPVAGMTAAPRITTFDPFEASGVTTTAPFTTVDPFAPITGEITLL